MSDNFNINTTQAQSLEAGGLDPNSPGQTLWDSMNKNQLAQQEQAQLVQQAIEKSKQAGIQTQEDQSNLDTGAYQAGKGLVPKAQAITTLKAGLDNSSIDDDQKASVLQDAEDTWPEVVSADEVHRMITALHEGRVTKLGEGLPFPATGKEVDGDGNPYPKGTMIQDIVDNDGNHTFVESNTPPAVIKAENGKNKATTDDLRAFGKEISGLMKTRFGSTGMLATTVFRADRAINTLTSQQTLTKQDLDNVSTDIAAIYQGGVPGQSQVIENGYGTSLTNLMDTLRHYTGVLSGFGLNQKVLSDTKAKLLGVLTDMRNSALASLKQIFEGLVSHYPSLSADDPAVVKIIDDAMAGLSSGMINAGRQVMPPTGAPPVAGTNPQGANNDPLGIR